MSALLDTMVAAGALGPVLVLLAAVMWWALGARAATLWSTSDGEPEVVRRAREDLRDVPPELVDGVLLPHRATLDIYGGAIRAIVATAPLAGLLGTVSGMIETFDSLGTMSLFTRGGGIGAGISEAMISTQLGLVVAVPGLLLGTLLDRRQTWLDNRLDAVAAEAGRS